MNINKAKNAVVPASFEYKYGAGDEAQTETITLAIKRGKLDLNIMESMKTAGEDTEKIAKFLVDLIDSWSLTEDDAGAKPYAITLENLKALPGDFFLSLVDAVTQSIQGK